MDCWHLLNGIISIMGVFVLSWVVLHPRIHEGLLIKMGMVAMIFSLGTTAYHTLGGTENWDALWRAGFWLRMGLFFAGCGVIHRAYLSPRRGKQMRRASDFVLGRD